MPIANGAAPTPCAQELPQYQEGLRVVEAQEDPGVATALMELVADASVVLSLREASDQYAEAAERLAKRATAARERVAHKISGTDLGVVELMPDSLKQAIRSTDSI